MYTKYTSWGNKTASPQTHFGFTIVGSKMHWNSASAIWSIKFLNETPCIKSYQEILYTVKDHNWFSLVTKTFFAKNQIRGRRKNLQEVRLNFILASACFFYLLLKAKCKNCLCIINDRGDKFSAKFINSLCLDDDVCNGGFFYHQFLAITNYLLD